MFLQKKWHFVSAISLAKGDEQAEKPDECCRSSRYAYLVRHEKIRLLVMFA